MVVWSLSLTLFWESKVKEEVKVFWQPHWTSCLRVKDYLSVRGIEYKSINVLQEGGMKELRELGVRTVPVVSRGKNFVFAQVIRDVVEFLELKEKINLFF